MYYILQPFKVLWKLWLMALFVNTMIIGYPAMSWLLSNPKRYYLAFRIIRFWSTSLLFLAGIIVYVKKEEKLPKGPFVICPNHTSYLDILSMYGVFKHYFLFMGKVEIMSWPLFNVFFSKGMNIAVDRQSRLGSHEAFERAKEEIDKGHSVVIFPEGTIPHEAPKMKAFKNGAFKLAMDKNVPIVPVTFLNNWQRLQVGPALKNSGGPGLARVIIHKPVYPADYAEKGLNEFKKDIFEAIEKPLIERYGN